MLGPQPVTFSTLSGHRYEEAGYGLSALAPTSALMAAFRPQHSGIAVATINATRLTGTTLGTLLAA
ncbi:hypothetical protein E1287_31470 [Actinomadura sp. KC06]|uniref:hypothetical protein n=1 Tax=Actinomadura sp. KC06 TaxID=2530369 RepID=UPI0010527A02|nr:hypothetical protein [Actinomadura sp. KC06]TDD29177.1 hypothetical protein E1287_31470 [Actinomadura sp. KC06]